MKKSIFAIVTLLLLSALLTAANKLVIKSGGKIDWRKSTLYLSVSVAQPLDRRRGESTLVIAKNRWKQQIYEALKTIPLSATMAVDTCLSPTGSHLLDNEIHHALEDAKINYYAGGAIDLSATISLETLKSVCGIALKSVQPNSENSIIIAFKHKKSFTPALQLSFSKKEDEKREVVLKTARYISSKETKTLIESEKIMKIQPSAKIKEGSIELSPEEFELIKRKDILIILQ
ncbi:hypothetical protein KAH37_02510 [bacterium]|nr:hypothetical protein [bacterium]